MCLDLKRSFTNKVHDTWGDADAVARLCVEELLDMASRHDDIPLKTEDEEDRMDLALRVGVLVGRFAGEEGRSLTAGDFLRAFADHFYNG